MEMQKYNKKAEKKFFIAIDILIFIACIILMVFEKRVNPLFLIIGLAFFIKSFYNIKTLKSL